MANISLAVMLLIFVTIFVGLYIETGGFIGIPFGDPNRANPKEPVISFHLDLDPDTRITAGTIDRRHPLLDAFFDDDQDYTEPIEQGFQLKSENDWLRQNTWISWEEKETENTPELFSVGNVTRYSLGALCWRDSSTGCITEGKKTSRVCCPIT